MKDPGTIVAQVANVISTDPALRWRLLQIANGALCRPRHPATSVQVAITRPGTSPVRALVTVLVIKHLYKTKAGGIIRQRVKASWQEEMEETRKLLA